jgi:formylglycine-generating enzyme
MLVKNIQTQLLRPPVTVRRATCCLIERAFRFGCHDGFPPGCGSVRDGGDAPQWGRRCIDEFEFPNREGDKPTLGLNFFEAAEGCKTGNKRLCTSREWELACEGDGRLPYPYGYTRDKTSCNIDKPYIIPDNDAHADPDKKDAEIARLDQREPSHRSGLKGGYWGPVRNRCRPRTVDHNEWHTGYQVGFRCCTEALPEVTPHRE